MYYDYKDFIARLKELEKGYTAVSNPNNRHKKMAKTISDAINMFEKTSRLTTEEKNLFLLQINLCMNASVKLISNHESK